MRQLEVTAWAAAARLGRWLVLCCGLLLLASAGAVPAFAQSQLQRPTPAIQSKADVPLYRQEPDLVRGRVSIPDGKLAVLVQPEGRDWRGFQTVTLRIASAVLILGMLGLLGLVLAVKGRIRIHAGRSGRTVPRFNGLDRAAHWLTAVSFIVLALSGLVVTFGRPLLIPLIGHPAFSALAQASKYGHNFFSIPFTLGIVLMVVLWIRDNLPERADLIWIRQAGGLLGDGGVHPESGRFNAGQKLLFWVVVLGGAAIAASGYFLMIPFGLTGIEGMQWGHMVHALLAALLITVIIGHIYIGTIGMEGAFDAMGSGRVDENWAREHHSRWYEEVCGPSPSSRGRRPDRLPAE